MDVRRTHQEDAFGTRNSALQSFLVVESGLYDLSTEGSEGAPRVGVSITRHSARLEGAVLEQRLHDGGAYETKENQHGGRMYGGSRRRWIEEPYLEHL